MAGRGGGGRGAPHGCWRGSCLGTGTLVSRLWDGWPRSPCRLALGIPGPCPVLPGRGDAGHRLQRSPRGLCPLQRVCAADDAGGPEGGGQPHLPERHGGRADRSRVARAAGCPGGDQCECTLVPRARLLVRGSAFRFHVPSARVPVLSWLLGGPAGGALCSPGGVLGSPPVFGRYERSGPQLVGLQFTCRRCSRNWAR